MGNDRCSFFQRCRAKTNPFSSGQSIPSVEVERWNSCEDSFSTGGVFSRFGGLQLPTLFSQLLGFNARPPIGNETSNCLGKRVLPLSGSSDEWYAAETGPQSTLILPASTLPCGAVDLPKWREARAIRAAKQKGIDLQGQAVGLLQCVHTPRMPMLPALSACLPALAAEAVVLCRGEVGKCDTLFDLRPRIRLGPV